MAGASGGEVASTLGTSLLGYFAGKKAEQRQGEIAGTAADKADPWGKTRGYYQSILGKMYGMPENYGEVGGPGGPAADTGEPSNEVMKMLEKLGLGSAEGGGLLGGLLGGAGGAATGGLLGGANREGAATGGLLGGLLGGGGGAGTGGLLGGLLG